MKYLLVAILFLSSCTQQYRHELTIALLFDNGNKDTVNAVVYGIGNITVNLNSGCLTLDTQYCENCNGIGCGIKAVSTISYTREIVNQSTK